jgi:hypothetical protein
MNPKKLHDSLLRGSMCTVWIGAIFLGIVNFIWSQEVEFGTDEQIKYLVRTTVCLGIGIIGALSHAHLLSRKKDE